MKKTSLFFLSFLFIFLSTTVIYSQEKVKITGKISKTEQSAENNYSLTVNFEIPEGFHQTRSDDFFFISFVDNERFKIDKIVYPEGILKDGLENYYGTVELKADFIISKNITGSVKTAKIKAAWQICNEDGVCFFPEEEIIEIPLEIPGTLPGSGGTPWILLQFLFFAFLGGLLLNVMPCVLPVLSMRALNLVRQSQNDRKSILIGSLLYGSGVLVSLLILALIVIILQMTGQLVGWGFQFQNPLFVMSLITIIFIFALSLFDVFLINVPGMNKMAAASNKKGWLGSFFNGIFAVLLATPCTAPFLGTALGFAFSQTPLFIITSFTAIGLGFALPFILIGIWPKLIQSLPKPGPWMDTFKEIMGFLLFGTVLYLFSSLQYQISLNSQFKFLIFLTLTAFIAWLYGKLSKPGSKFPSAILALIIAFILLGVSSYFLIDGKQNIQGTEEPGLRKGWEEFNPDSLEQYRKEGKAVFIDFGAKWCSVCKINEGRVLLTERGNSFFKERSIIRMKGDYTNKDPLIDKWIKKFGKAGVPVYAYYPADGSNYILLPELLSFRILEDYIPVQNANKKLDDSLFLIQPSK